MKKHLVSWIAASLLCLLAGCAATGSHDAGTSSAGGSGSGITVFGTIDAAVSGYKNQSR